MGWEKRTSEPKVHGFHGWAGLLRLGPFFFTCLVVRPFCVCVCVWRMLQDTPMQKIVMV